MTSLFGIIATKFHVGSRLARLINVVARLSKLPGIGPAKCEKYGREILILVNQPD